MDKSIFIEFIGDSAMARVLDYLLTERDLDFSISDMARNAGIGRTTIYRIWNNLVKNDIIIFTRRIGLAKLYKLNMENPRIRKMAEIYDMLVIEELKKSRKIKVAVKN